MNIQTNRSLTTVGKSELGRSADLVPIPTDVKPPWIAIAERQTPRIARSLLAWSAFFILTGIAWAYFSQIDRVVTARGKVVTHVPQVVVQPLETGVVRAVNVRVGQRVAAGEVLGSLDPTFVGADLAVIRNQRDGLAAQIVRLRAEFANLVPERFSPHPIHDALQRSTFETRRAQHAAQVLAFDAEIAELETRLVRNDIQRKSLQDQLEILGEIEEMRTTLLDKGAGSRLQWLLIRNELTKMRRDLESAEKEPAELTARIEQTRARRTAFVNDWAAKTLEVLTIAERDFARADEDFKKSERRSKLIDLVAPVEAVVLEIAPRSKGSVVREAETLFTLVPIDVPMEVEIEIDPADVGFVKAGNTVRLKLDTLPFQRHGTFSGRLAVVGENTLTSAEARTQTPVQVPVYRGLVEITEDVRSSLRDLPDNFRLIPGMRVAAEIQIGRRSVLSFIVEPIYRGAEEGMRSR